MELRRPLLLRYDHSLATLDSLSRLQYSYQKSSSVIYTLSSTFYSSSFARSSPPLRPRAAPSVRSQLRKRVEV